ncbi:hypothetical protein [Ruminococcus sp.]|uniref:hypothetical protein n=1 Tax=Ruminococcus sp. TaxID=41978 RepID=UPI0025EBB686|nr:hypothetical protein [Ruminococcus sp.]MBQ9543100.1 hypothetical protein [Ruminococcus sp.]
MDHNNYGYNNYGYTGKVCPKCGCPDCRLINETTTKGGDYGVCSGICGYLIMGPVGLLCGLCGKDTKIETKTRAYWVCPNCDKKFKA